jgi:hypothetical protein
MRHLDTGKSHKFARGLVIARMHRRVEPGGSRIVAVGSDRAQQSRYSLQHGIFGGFEGDFDPG